MVEARKCRCWVDELANLLLLVLGNGDAKREEFISELVRQYSNMIRWIRPKIPVEYQSS
jgi:hypothetical protein